GRLITFDGGLVDLNNVAAVTPAFSATPSSPDVDSSPLSLELLSALDIDLGGGIQLFGENGVIGVGALGQYAESGAGTAYASAGAVGADGSISVGGGDPADNAYLDLTNLLNVAGLGDITDTLVSEL